ncbi:MAG: dihydropteroate synthase [Planctomycetes bacterium]|nr:dihydropteroate synthase [Planctomycetota bacterium]
MERPGTARGPRLLGVVNLTDDSFSDGGRFRKHVDALQHALELVEQGAARIDLGAQSTHPEAELVGPDEEWRRLEPVLRELVAARIEVSIDTFEPHVMERALELGAACINDVTALRDERAVRVVAASRCELILMHSTSRQARAEREAPTEADWVERIVRFFDERLAALARLGVVRERVIVDPGLGLFLSSAPEPSFEVLRRIGELRQRVGQRVCVAPSRKSFLGAALGRAPLERGAATLAAELWCAAQGVDWIRTHDVRAASDALRTWRALAGV